MISRDDVEAAAARLAGVANRTPIFRSRTLDERVGAEVFLKAESLQRTGSFKFRGAFNAVSQTDAGGVTAFSSGNHAQAVALAARLTGKEAVILMPLDAPAAKVEATAERPTNPSRKLGGKKLMRVRHSGSLPSSLPSRASASSIE